MAANTPIDKVANIYQKLFNPLRFLTKPQIERMTTDWQHGSDVQMQLVFTQVEQMSPIYQVCIQKRCAGVLNREWDVLPVDDSQAAKDQAEQVKKLFEKANMRNEDGLTEALRHLVMSSFRGRAALKPFFSDSGDLLLKRLDNWNVLYWNGKLYWNPSSEPAPWFTDEESVPFAEIPKSEVCFVRDDMPIDVPGVMIYLRQLVGEEQWARFIEKQGIPQIVIKAPDGTPAQNLEQWNFRAQQLFEGGSGVLPSGAEVTSLDSARGQDPFTNYLQHQMEMISILATGGTLMTIGGSTGLGSDLARVQQESFNSLVNQDCRKISNAVTDCVVRKCVRRLFGDGAKALCRFTFVEDDEYGPRDYFEFAEKAQALGFKIDAKEFKRLAKVNFIQEDETWTPQ